MKCVYLAIFFTAIYTVSVAAKPTDLEDTYGILADENNPRADDYYDEPEESPPDEDNESTIDETPPVFETKPQEFKTKIGEQIVLPCKVSNLGAYVRIWTREQHVLFQSDIRVQAKENLHLTPTGFLQMNVQSPDDAGEYACKILVTDEKTIKVIHKVFVHTAPKILSIYTHDNRTKYSVDEKTEITCKATGYPKPRITWYKGPQQTEKLTAEGETLTIDKLKSHNSDFYRCLADNGDKNPAHASIEIQVEHIPSVHIEKYTVNSDKEMDAELKCIVHAYPAAIVNWQRNGQNIVSNPPHIVLNKTKNRHILTIKNLEEDDFGTYNCVAKNYKGQTERNATLIKTPAIREFVKPKNDTKDVVLTWRVESKAPISEHEVQYRKKGEHEWHTLKPEVTNGKDDIYTVNYTLKDLDVGLYETRVRSQNTHGWSDYSDVTSFEGDLPKKHAAPHKHHNKKQHKQKEKQMHTAHEGTPAQHQENELKDTSLGASKTSGASAEVSSIVLISIALLTLLENRP